MLGTSMAVKRIFYPGATTKNLRFPMTFKGIDHKRANCYLLNESPSFDCVALFGLPDDVGYATAMLYHPRVSALKMYYSYVDPTATKIYEFFKPEILEVSQDLDIPIILHLLRRITESADDLSKVVNDFPRLRITLAHLGLTKFMIKGLEEAYVKFAKYLQISMDTSLCPSSEVIELAIRIFGPDWIMFGSDGPYHLIRSTAYEHPIKGQRIVADYAFHWVDREEYKQFGHLAKGAIHSNWT